MRGAWVGTVMAAAVVLAGCGGGSDPPRTLPPVPSRSVGSPSVAASGSGSAAPSGSATSTLSPAPSLSPSPGVAGDIEAAVINYFDAANEALQTGDVTRLKSLSVDGCTCRILVRYIQKSFKRGTPVGARFELLSIRVREIRGHTAAAQIRYHVPAYKLVAADGHVIERYPAGVGRDDTFWGLVNGKWLDTGGVRLE